jgi:hypothetical protein
MDFAFDYYFENNITESVLIREFIYDEKRIFSKIYVFFKFLCLLFYGIIFVFCNRSDFFIIMITFMFLSTINSIRYEYEHFKRYGTTFSSIYEFTLWKKELYPRLRIFLSFIEGIIKIIFFIKNFPPQFHFQNFCEICDSFVKIHIIVIFMIYIIAGFFSIAILCSIYCYNNYEANRTRNIQTEIISSSFTFPIIIVNNQNEECCICLDKGNINDWSILPCGHKFHHSCILIWMSTNQTCPICRCNIS